MFKIRNFNKPRSRGQSTVEYLVLVTAVIAAMILFLTKKDTGMQGKLGNVLNQVSDGITDKADTLNSSHTGTLTDTAPSINVDINADPFPA